jgi:hypothetical protein
VRMPAQFRPKAGAIDSPRCPDVAVRCLFWPMSCRPTDYYGLTALVPVGQIIIRRFQEHVLPRRKNELVGLLGLESNSLDVVVQVFNLDDFRVMRKPADLRLIAVWGALLDAQSWECDPAAKPAARALLRKSLLRITNCLPRCNSRGTRHSAQPEGA